MPQHPPIRVQITGKRWMLRFVPLKKSDADCDHKVVTGKQIRVDSRLRGQALLDCIVHEGIHCIDIGQLFPGATLFAPDGSEGDATAKRIEAFVDGAATDLARILWRLGYRMKGVDDE